MAGYRLLKFVCMPLALLVLVFNLQSYPSLASYYERLCQRPGVKSSWPPHWLDDPGTKPLSGI